jgi:hypothetical protein
MPERAHAKTCGEVKIVPAILTIPSELIPQNGWGVQTKVLNFVIESVTKLKSVELAYS